MRVGPALGRRLDWRPAEVSSSLDYPGILGYEELCTTAGTQISHPYEELQAEYQSNLSILFLMNKHSKHIHLWKVILCFQA